MIRYDQQAKLQCKATLAKGHTRSPAIPRGPSRRSHTEVGEDRWLTRSSLTLPKLYLATCKIPKISPGLIFFKGPFEWFIYGENLRFKIDWASPIVGRKFTVFALFYFVLAGKYKAPKLLTQKINMEVLIFGILRYSP